MTRADTRNVLIEGVVIVASILLAFSLDAWWDERQESARVDRLLDAVALDFESEIAVLDSVIHENDTYGAYLGALIARTDARHPRLSDDSLAILVEGTRDHQIYDPAFGSLTALVSTGGLEQIEDLELQRRLAGWNAELDDLTWERDQAFEAVDAWVERITDTGILTSTLVERGPQFALAKGVVDDPVIRNRVTLVLLAYVNYTSDLRRIRDRARDVADQIRAR